MLYYLQGVLARGILTGLKKNYGPVKKHIGLEAYSEKPEGLPAYVEWIANSADDMSDVESNSVDLVFSGQTVEHLSADALFGFLFESNRVLREGGYLVVDSPNRKITQANKYIQPEHTLELTDDELVDLLFLPASVWIQSKGYGIVVVLS